MMFKQRDRQQKGAETRGKKRGAAGGMQKLPMGEKTKKQPELNDCASWV